MKVAVDSKEFYVKVPIKAYNVACGEKETRGYIVDNLPEDIIERAIAAIKTIEEIDRLIEEQISNSRVKWVDIPEDLR